jgi:hypothetical protein
MFFPHLIRNRTPDDAGTSFILPVIKLTVSRNELPSSWVYYSTLFWQLTIIPSLIVLIFYPPTYTDIRSYPMVSCFFSLSAHGTQHSSLHYKDQSGWEVINVHGSLCKALGIFSHLNHFGLCRYMSVKPRNMKSVWWKSLCSMRTDMRDEANSRVSQVFCIRRWIHWRKLADGYQIVDCLEVRFPMSMILYFIGMKVKASET